ncbi:MAG: hypothetical protein N2116_04335, partial [Armatimonadetes bacterium]|nr:hypothetical protein [Armatimonadota bacterium]
MCIRDRDWRAPNSFGEKIPPSKGGAQKIRQQLWAKAHSMVGKIVTNKLCSEERRHLPKNATACLPFPESCRGTSTYNCRRRGLPNRRGAEMPTLTS